MGYLTKDLTQTKKTFDEILGIKENFDIMNREMLLGGRKTCLYFIDGFVKDEILNRLLEFFYNMKQEEMPKDAEAFQLLSLPYIEVDLISEKEEILRNILSGVPCFFVDGYEKGLAIDCRTYPARSVTEPDKDKVMRGSKDGFVETIVFNTALIRRRIRSVALRMEMLSVGTTSKTDVVLCYMEHRVDLAFLHRLKEKIANIKVDALTMNQQSLAECLYKKGFINPFPKFKFTERPDTTAASVLEGSIAILVDNSPSAMILPVSIFDIVEEANDYYFPPVTGTYLRVSRLLINFIALFLTPFFLLLMQNPEWIPKTFEFINVKEAVNLPLVWQFLILEFAIDGLRLASLNTPSMLSTPLSVIAALIIGDFTVSSGWFNAEAMLYMAFVTIANYSQASFELGYALKFLRMIHLVLTGMFGLWGFLSGVLITVVAISCNKTISGRSYISPFFPWNGKQFLRRILRIGLQEVKNDKQKEK